MKWSKEEWEGLEEAFVWCITKETSRTKLFPMDSLVKLAQHPAQAVTSAYTMSGQEDGSFPSEAHRLNLQGICQRRRVDGEGKAYLNVVCVQATGSSLPVIISSPLKSPLTQGCLTSHKGL